jgi:hypothetical protein
MPTAMQISSLTYTCFFSVTECQFGKSLHEIGTTWFADLGPPFGVMYCIKCECVPVSIALQRRHCEISSSKCVTGVTGKWGRKNTFGLEHVFGRKLGGNAGLCIRVCNSMLSKTGCVYLLSEDVVRQVAGRWRCSSYIPIRWCVRDFP